MVILRADRRLCAATVGMVTPLHWISDQELRGAGNPAFSLSKLRTASLRTDSYSPMPGSEHLMDGKYIQVCTSMYPAVS